MPLSIRIVPAALSELKAIEVIHRRRLALWSPSVSKNLASIWINFSPKRPRVKWSSRAGKPSSCCNPSPNRPANRLPPQRRQEVAIPWDQVKSELGLDEPSKGNSGGSESLTSPHQNSDCRVSCAEDEDRLPRPFPRLGEGRLLMNRASQAGLSEQFGRYRILKTLGEGGMGAVYLAQDTQLDRQVALEGASFLAPGRPGGHRSLLPRGPRRGDARPPEPLPGLRRRPDRRDPLPDDALHRGQAAVRVSSTRPSRCRHVRRPRWSTRWPGRWKRRTAGDSSTAT